MFGEWKVRIQDLPWTPDYNRIYLIRTAGGHTYVLDKDGKQIELKEGHLANEDSYFAEMTNDQLQALANALADRGVKTTNDHKNAGLLEAKNDHLQDMRQLVFKDAKK